MFDDSIDLAVFTAILNGTVRTAAVHHMSASVDELFEVTNSRKPLTPNDLWDKYYRPPLETYGLTSETDCETKVIPAPETLDAFVAINQRSTSLAGLELNLVDTETYHSNQNACSGIPNCTGWWRFSRIGYNRRKSEALVHTDYDDPRYGLMGMGHFVLLRRDSGLWLVAAKHMTWIS
jgi:hypothetical protein